MDLTVRSPSPATTEPEAKVGSAARGLGTRRSREGERGPDIILKTDPDKVSL